jgi:hypothetical protein
MRTEPVEVREPPFDKLRAHRKRQAQGASCCAPPSGALTRKAGGSAGNRTRVQRRGGAAGRSGLGRAWRETELARADGCPGRSAGLRADAESKSATERAQRTLHRGLGLLDLLLVRRQIA